MKGDDILETKNKKIADEQQLTEDVHQHLMVTDEHQKMIEEVPVIKRKRTAASMIVSFFFILIIACLKTIAIVSGRFSLLLGVFFSIVGFSFLIEGQFIDTFWSFVIAGFCVLWFFKLGAIALTKVLKFEEWGSTKIQEIEEANYLKSESGL